MYSLSDSDIDIAYCVAPYDPAVACYIISGCKFSTANQNPSNKWFLIATQRTKLSSPSERALKTELKNSVRLFVAFCLT